MRIAFPDRRWLCGLLLAMATMNAPAVGAQSPPDRARDFIFTYHSVIAVPDRAARLEAWVPLPRNDGFQSISELTVESLIPTKIVDQHHDGNRVLHVEADAPLPRTIPVTVRFKVRRIEESAALAQTQPVWTASADGEFLHADRLVPIDGKIEQVSATIGDGSGTPYEQARAIYEWVVANMKYDKSGTGWGRGDAIYACDVKKGNCTDFHSLFIALARSRGIPARFTIGFPVGIAKSGAIPGYHCWAEFYANGQWVPVDASEAWKHPERRDYYFGHLDADRVAFTTGRDLVLEPKQAGEPLNYLIYPYVEVDGWPLPTTAATNQFEYVDVGLNR